MGRRLIERHQPTSPRSETAQAVWVDVLAEIIVAAVPTGEPGLSYP